MIRTKLKSVLLICALITLSACKKEDPNPELKDPIFSDLQKRSSDAAKTYEEELKKLEDAKSKLAKSEAGSIEHKNFRRDIANSEIALVGMRERKRYYEIRAERRMYEGRLAYKEAFARGEEWPNPREYSDYLVNIRLREVPKNWNARVPKLQDRLPSSVSKGEKPKASEKPAGH